jgi:hypothetical protein
MDAIHFQTEVGNDNTIHVPEGVTLPAGPAEVTVMPRQDAAADIATTREWLLRLAGEADQDPTPLPSDMAENHDFYAHGKPRERAKSLPTRFTSSPC